MIFSDYFYAIKLAKKEYKIRSIPLGDTGKYEFCPARSFEVFPVWMDYIRKFYPDEHILFIDNCSEIPFQEAMDVLGNPTYEYITEGSYEYNPRIKIHVQKFDNPAYYFDAVQRQRVAALKFAYFSNLDYFWTDTDCLVNTDLRSLFNGYDIFAPTIAYDQLTIDSHCIFISKEKLHEWDDYYKLPDFLDYIMTCPDENQSVRHHTLFEGGMFKLFCYGKVNSSDNINESHSACYTNLVKFLELNPLESKGYINLLGILKNLDTEEIISRGGLLTYNDRFSIENKEEAK